MFALCSFCYSANLSSETDVRREPAVMFAPAHRASTKPTSCRRRSSVVPFVAEPNPAKASAPGHQVRAGRESSVETQDAGLRGEHMQPDIWTLASRSFAKIKLLGARRTRKSPRQNCHLVKQRRARARSQISQSEFGLTGNGLARRACLVAQKAQNNRKLTPAGGGSRKKSEK